MDLSRAALKRGLTALLIGVLAAVLLVRAIARPLGRVTGALSSIAEGDLGEPVELRSRDEVGRLAAAFNAMRDCLSDKA